MKVLTIKFLLAFSNVLWASENLSCSSSEKREVHFSEATIKDTIELRFIGDSCQIGRLVLFIYKGNGDVIYEYEYSYRGGSYELESEEMVSYLKGILGRMVGDSSSIQQRETCPKDHDCQHGYFPNADIGHQSKISYEEYMRLKNNPVPTITHDDGREAWRTLYFDKSKDKVLTLILSYV